MTESELKPCAHCGGVDGRLVQAFTRAAANFAFWSVECLDCGCEIVSLESQAEADAHWNTRTHPPEYARLIEAARKVVKGYASNTGNPSELMHELDEASVAAIKEARP